MRLLAVVLILFASSIAPAQARRVSPTPGTVSSIAADVPVKQMFDEANTYSRNKFAEFEAKKIRFSEALRLQTEREQKQLAAKYAAAVSASGEISGIDLYYHGLLHWIAENLDGTAESLRKYVAGADTQPDKVQTSRSILTVISAKQKKFEEAENLLTEYQRAEPSKLTERARMSSELAKAYIAMKEYTKAGGHADAAYKSAKGLLADPSSRVRALDEVLDCGMLVFESFRAIGDIKKAEDALADMRNTAASVGSSSFFFYAADRLITYQIESGRKAVALETYMSSLIQAGKELASKGENNEAIQKLKQREKHYNLLGGPAVELLDIDHWFPGEQRTLASMKGRVILLDFWATWCTPCFEAFPHLAEWQSDFREDGLVILGVTRYYGRAEGYMVDNANEIQFLTRFRKKYNLPYDFVVARNQQAQMQYGATALPTAVLIDRKGVIRYIQSGTSASRLVEMREMLMRLLAEK
jgi:thiol-disulfide isomerase/thioredoxin